jgi:hypothetical protein
MKSCAAFEMTSIYDSLLFTLPLTQLCPRQGRADMKLTSLETDKTGLRMTGRIITAVLRGHDRTRLLPTSTGERLEQCAFYTCIHTCSTSCCNSRLHHTLLLSNTHNEYSLLIASQMSALVVQSCTLPWTLILAHSRQTHTDCRIRNAAHRFHTLNIYLRHHCLYTHD